MAWIYLLAAGGFEIVATTLFRYVDGFSRLVPSVLFFAAGLTSFLLLNKAVATIPIGTAYAIWTGIGAAGTALVGLAFYSEPTSTMRLVFLTLLVGSIMGLKLVS